jgi:hypothetical protein
MKKDIITIGLNKVQSTNPNGLVSPNTISQAWNFQEIAEDIFVEGNNGKHFPFIIIPLSEGVIKVKLSGNTGEIYTISSEEVSAFIGTPMLYLVDTIIFEGTTVTKLSIGI